MDAAQTQLAVDKVLQEALDATQETFGAEDASEEELLRAQLYCIESKIANAPLVTHMRVFSIMGKHKAAAEALGAETRALRERVEAVERAIMCSICYDTMEKPWTLVDCGHAFCQDCTKWIVHNNPACPMCDKDILGLPVCNGAVEEVSAAVRGRMGELGEGWDVEGVEEAFRTAFQDAAGGAQGQDAAGEVQD